MRSALNQFTLHLRVDLFKMLLPILFVLALAGSLWFLLKHVYSHWERKGFPSLKPSIPIGNLQALVRRERSFNLTICDLYRKSEEPYVGIYLLYRPALLIRDPELAYRILVTDFSSFHDRGLYSGNDQHNALMQNLFSARGEKWRTMRSYLSPSFSSGKLKAMFPTFIAVGEELDRFLEPKARNNEVIEFRDIFFRFIVDVIASVFFGVEANTIQNPKCMFRTMLHKVNDPDFAINMKLALMFFVPSLIDKIGVNVFPEEIQDFLMNLVKQTIEHRETTNEVRKDFMQLLIQLRNGNLNAQDGDWNIKTSDKKVFSVAQCAAQVFAFYIGGSDTSSGTASFALYELCQNPDTLKRLQAEIDATLPKYNNEITYEAIKEMKYLDQCIQETLRKYPGLPALTRECVKDYRIPDSKHTIKKGTLVTIPVLSYHRDAKHFENPNEFNPDRFGERKNFNERIYMPFGAGPHGCIGVRMAKMSVKCSLVKLLSKYNVEALEKKEMEFDNFAVVLWPKGGVRMRISMR